jgi:hypothetical protein
LWFGPRLGDTKEERQRGKMDEEPKGKTEEEPKGGKT